MLPDRVSNPGPLTYESGALPIALRGPAQIYALSDNMDRTSTITPPIILQNYAPLQISVTILASTLLFRSVTLKAYELLRQNLVQI